MIVACVRHTTLLVLNQSQSLALLIIAHTSPTYLSSLRRLAHCLTGTSAYRRGSVAVSCVLRESGRRIGFQKRWKQRAISQSKEETNYEGNERLRRCRWIR